MRCKETKYLCTKMVLFKFLYSKDEMFEGCFAQTLFKIVMCISIAFVSKFFLLKIYLFLSESPIIELRTKAWELSLFLKALTSEHKFHTNPKLF